MVFPYKPSILGYHYFWKHPYVHWFVFRFFNNPKVLDIMATLSNLAVRAAAFATTYPECLHWKYRQRWVGDMVIYGSHIGRVQCCGATSCYLRLTLHRGVFWVIMIGTKILIYNIYIYISWAFHSFIILERLGFLHCWNAWNASKQK